MSVCFSYHLHCILTDPRILYLLSLKLPSSVQTPTPDGLSTISDSLLAAQPVKKYLQYLFNCNLDLNVDSDLNVDLDLIFCLDSNFDLDLRFDDLNFCLSLKFDNQF